MTPERAPRTAQVAASLLLAGFGETNRAVARALLARGHTVAAFDDAPSPEAQADAAAMGMGLEAAPSQDRLAQLLRAADAVVPTPGLPEAHPVLELARARRVETVNEFDLAAAWDSRPIAAITGTSGKTTVTDIVAGALQASGLAAVAAGNNDVPLVTAIDDADADVFVVEASSFRLAHSRRFAPVVACWLNFAADHLDVHRDLASYEAAKARLWQRLPATAVAVANRDDPTVMSHLRKDRAAWTFASRRPADWFVEDGALTGPHGPILAAAELRRRMPHDMLNALAAAATATAAGATAEGVREALRRYEPGAHRVQRVATIGGVSFYDDSKATTPHATVAALRGFERVVLIAGGRNKGLDLGRLLDAVAHVSSVVAIGEAGADVAETFAGHRPVTVAADMGTAVELAAEAAGPGTSVLLSPACASFDAYTGYAQRGDDFVRAVSALRRSTTSKAGSR